MKRLFLASSGLGYLREFVQRDPTSVNMLFIPTAGNLDDNVWWIDKDRDVLKKMGFNIAELDIAKATTKEMKEALAWSGIVYVAGGNTFYLLLQLQDTDFGGLLINYIDGGGMYAGASAGAIIVGPDIEPISSIDEPELVEGLATTSGLGLVEVVLVPHYSMETRKDSIDAINAKYAGKYEIVTLTDDQAIVVEGDEWKIVTSERSALEHEWFDKNKEDLV